MFFLRFEHGFDLSELAFELEVFGMFDYKGWVTDDGAEEFLFGYLFEVGEAEFGEEFLTNSTNRYWQKRTPVCIPCNGLNLPLEMRARGLRTQRRRHRRCGGRLVWQR